MHRPHLQLLMFSRKSLTSKMGMGLAAETVRQAPPPPSPSPSSSPMVNLAPKGERPPSSFSSPLFAAGQDDSTARNGSVSLPNATSSEATTGEGPVWIQRLIILHDGLLPPPLPPHEGDANDSPSRTAPKRRRHPQAHLSEDASLEEHGEFILYYYDHSSHAHRRHRLQMEEQRRRHQQQLQLQLHSSSLHDHRQRRRSSLSAPWTRRRDSTGSILSVSSHFGEEGGGGDGRYRVGRGRDGMAAMVGNATEDAVKFAGLCRALRSLPQALRPQSPGDDDDIDDETDVVHLADSTLVFVPLELNGDVVAVAQVPRAAHPSHVRRGRVDGERLPLAGTRRGYGADPAALRHAIREIHRSFSLICGGGIHRRLWRTRRLEEGSEEWVWETEEDEDEDARFLLEEYGSGAGSGVDDNNNTNNNNKSSPAKSPTAKLIRLSGSKNGSKLFAFEHDGDENEPNPRNSTTTPTSTSKTNISSKNDQSNLHPTQPNDYSYGGMKELFQLRKEHRKLTNERIHNSDSHYPPHSKSGGASGRGGGTEGTESASRRWNSTSSAADLFNDIVSDIGTDDITRRIDKLLQILPITQLRIDLMKFYDEWLERYQNICEVMEGGIGRCVVEMIPPPYWRPRTVPTMTSTSTSTAVPPPARGQHPPLAPDAFVCLAASEFMTSLMEEEVPSLIESDGREFTETTPRLFGMSVLYHDRLVLSKVLPIDGDRETFPPDIPWRIVEYFRSPEKNRLLSQGSRRRRSFGDSQSLPQPQPHTHAGGDGVPHDANATAGVHHAFDRFMSNLSIGASANKSSTETTTTTTTATTSTTAIPLATSTMKQTPPTSRSNSLDAIRIHDDFKASTSGYLEPPPSSFVDFDKPPDFLFVPKLGHQIWLPQIYLPYSEIDHDDEVETHVAMFECRDFTFLLFFDLPVSKGGEARGVLGQMEEELQPTAAQLVGPAGAVDDEIDEDISFEEESAGISDETLAFTETLCFLKDRITEFCETYSCHEPNEGSSLMAPIKEVDSHNIFLGEPGMDIIYVDREQSSFVLLSQHDLTTKKFRRVASVNGVGGAAVLANGNHSSLSNSGKQKKGLFGFGTKIKETCELETKNPVVYQVSPYANIMDCRHKLAAYMPLDVMLALDDMFTEIGRQSRSYVEDSNELMDDTALSNMLLDEGSNSVELCTFLPQTWVYGRSSKSQELYILLDTKKFVTISDVQKAVSRVGEKLFSNKLL